MNPNKPDARIPVKLPLATESIDGLDVEFSFSGNFVLPVPNDALSPKFSGTLICTGMEGDDGVSVRLVTNQPLEDVNGREVHQVDLDQPSIDSLRQGRDDGTWCIRLPDLIRPGR